MYLVNSDLAAAFKILIIVIRYKEIVENRFE